MSARVAIVTGSSSGIGHATLLAFAAAGDAVVVHGGAEDADFVETVAAAEALGVPVAAVAGDVADPSTQERLVAAAVALGELRVVVSNAGAGMTRTFDELTDADWERVVQTHLIAAARLLRLAHPHLGAGTAVVLMSSLAAQSALSGRAAYGAAKGGIESLTLQLAAEWAPEGIRVNAVAPGTILTPLVRRNFELGLLDREGVLSRTPLGRLGEPAEIASVVRFLASDDASYVTGQTIRVDGGWSIWGGWS